MEEQNSNFFVFLSVLGGISPLAFLQPAENTTLLGFFAPPSGVPPPAPLARVAKTPLFLAV